MSEPERSHVDLDGGPIEVDVVHGDPSRPTLVFLHEGLGSIDQWRGVPSEIAGRVGGATVVTYARHGHGRSGPAEVPRPVTYMHHEADVVLPALLDALDITDPVLVGHSDGASIALLAAGRGIGRAVVALAPHVFVEDISIAGITAAREAFESTDLPVRLGRYHRDAATMFRGWNDVWLSDEFRSWNIEDRLPGIAVPLLAIQGGDDEYGTVAQIDAIERCVVGPCECVLIAGVGHSPHLEARDEVVERIAGFVRRV